MKSVFRPIFALALGAALAACSHSSNSVVPMTGAHAGSSMPNVQYFGQRFGDAAQVCGQVKLGEARCNAWVRTDVHAPIGSSPNNIFGYKPADLQSAYNLPSSTKGAGQTVAVVDAFDDPNAESDLAVYRSQWGLPACTTSNGCFQKVNQFGQTSPLPQADTTGWSVEESLDLDMVSAICPNCHIILVEANTNNDFPLGLSVDTAVAMGASAVSNSYGGDEQGTQRFEKYYHHRHAIITASTGDSGYGVQFPAASGFVVAVSGTRLVPNSGSKRGWSETAWGGDGSGCSAFYPKPSWQSDPLCTNRTVADVSAEADPGTGVAVYDTYRFDHGWIELGGTSVSSPILAAIYGLKGNGDTLDYAHSIYTAKPVHLNDVTTGINGNCGNYLCQAGPGYDGPTGMGTPEGVGAF
jgi:subtilase family serine protease